MPPHFRTFTTGGAEYSLRYTERLAKGHPDKAVFVASTEPGGRVVVVKFTHSYSKAAHALLSDRKLAPRLQYCERVKDVGMYVVVMDFVTGEHVVETHTNELLSNKLRAAVKVLHDEDYVHGDLREPNILIKGDGGIKIIDFNWAGKVGEAYYPPHINLDKAVGWHPDVTSGGLIDKAHDLAMLRRLTGSGLEV